VLKAVITIVLALIVPPFIGGYAYYGGFSKLRVAIATQGGETVVYKDIVGNYHQGAVVMNALSHLLRSNLGIETSKGYGIYPDNPKEGEKGKRCSEAGCIIDDKDMEKADSLPDEFKIKVLPIKRYITAEFPFKGKPSVMVSLMRVYPALAKFAKDSGINQEGAIIEIYDIPNGKIMYRKEIIK
jgi:hypothetical protein